MKESFIYKSLRSRRRSDSGATLTEMLIASLLLGFTIAAIGEVMVLTSLSANKMTNRASGINATRSIINRLQTDVRQARSFGDYYAARSERNTFPSTNNPLYDSASGPKFASTNFSWSGWPADWPTRPYSLDGQTLILQQPVYFLDPTNDPLSATFNSSALQNSLNGLPIMLKKDDIASGAPAADLENLDTVVYRLIQDPNEATEFILQRARYVGFDGVSGLPTSSFRSMIDKPQTILTGIIGPKPIDGSTTPQIFTYLMKDPTTGLQGTISGAELALNPYKTDWITGVALDIELKKPDSSTGSGNAAYQQRLGIHTETFLRYSRFISLKNRSD